MGNSADSIKNFEKILSQLPYFANEKYCKKKIAFLLTFYFTQLSCLKKQTINFHAFQILYIKICSRLCVRVRVCKSPLKAFERGHTESR